MNAPLTVLPQAADALELTLRLTPEEIDPHVLEVRVRAIAAPVVASELRRLAGELLDEHSRLADQLNDLIELSETGGEPLDPAERRLRHSVNETIRAAATKLARRAEELNEQPPGA